MTAPTDSTVWGEGEGERDTRVGREGERHTNVSERNTQVPDPAKFLAFYARGAQVPADACKNFNNGRFSGTDINPMWRIKILTELFGPCGIGWWTDEPDFWTEDYPNGEQKVYCRLALYYRDPETGETSKPIFGYGGNSVLIQKKDGQVLANDEYLKMAETDAFGSVCKKLGIGASVYWSADRTKYTITEEGVTAYAPSKEEISREKRQKMAENTDSFFGKKDTPKVELVPDDPEETAKAEKLAEEGKARRASVDPMGARAFITRKKNAEPDNEVIVHYVGKFGQLVSRWPDNKAIDCYLDLMMEGEQ